jgi:predicted nucleic acid-binding Zn ribbon protein
MTEYHLTCIVCDKDLKDKQRSYCSATCNTTASRRTRWERRRIELGLPEHKPCAACGRKMYVTSPRKVRCGENDPFYEPCIEARQTTRDEAEAASERARNDRMDAATFKDCERCGEEIYKDSEYMGGPVPRFCSTRCRVAAHRAKKKAECNA